MSSSLLYVSLTVLLSGIYAGLTMFVVLSFAYFVPLLSLSELVGIVPFSGGNFGFERCALGPFWGYLAACMEFMYYCMYNARTLGEMSLLVEATGEFDQDCNPCGRLSLCHLLLL